MAKKQYYFIKFQSKGRTYYKNQDGARVSRAKVESGRRKIFVELGRTIGPDLKKGDLISYREYRTKVKSQKPPQIPEVSTFNVMNVNLQKEVALAINQNKSIYIQKDGKTYNLKSKKSRAALQLFISQINSAFYGTIGKKTESPIFNIQISDAP
jgi:hypothetical protein